MNGPRLRLDHIGIAVKDLAEARERFGKLLGAVPSPVEEVPSEGVRLCFFDLGGVRIELLEGTSSASPIRKFLDRGGSGVHHLSVEVEGEDLDLFASRLAGAGVEIVGGATRPGSGGSKVLFVHPRSASGLLLEFSHKEGTTKA